MRAASSCGRSSGPRPCTNWAWATTPPLLLLHHPWNTCPQFSSGDCKAHPAGPRGTERRMWMSFLACRKQPRDVTVLRGLWGPDCQGCQAGWGDARGCSHRIPRGCLSASPHPAPSRCCCAPAWSWAGIVPMHTARLCGAPLGLCRACGPGPWRGAWFPWSGPPSGAVSHQVVALAQRSWASPCVPSRRVSLSGGQPCWWASHNHDPHPRLCQKVASGDPLYVGGDPQMRPGHTCLPLKPQRFPTFGLWLSEAPQLQIYL